MDNSKEHDEPKEQNEPNEQAELVVDPTGDWPGKNIDWSTDVVEAKLHVELPFWIAAPDGTVNVKIGDCDLGIQFRNSVVGVYREGHFFRSERSLAQITTEGMPFSDDQKKDLESLGAFGQRHFRTMLTLSAKVHESIYSLLDSESHPVRRDGEIYVRSLGHASIRFINDFLSAYRAASYDPFVAHVSYWDLPVLHLSNSAKSVWSIPMVAYRIADKLPAIDTSGLYFHRVSTAQIQQATQQPIPISMEELLDAWTCFYRGQFAEAIRKVVTAIEVALVDLLFRLPQYRQGKTDDEVLESLAKMKFNKQLSFYLQATGRRLPGPLTHIAPEVNGVRLEQELDHARERRHKIVHESEKIDYEHHGPILRIMETMSWLHGWMLEDPVTLDPTKSPLYNTNANLRKLFLLEPVADSKGLRLVPPADEPGQGDFYFLHQAHIEKLLEASSKQRLDSAFCVAWTFQAIRRSLIIGKHREDWPGHHERYWLRNGTTVRSLFIIETDGGLSRGDIDSVVCRFSVLQRKHAGIERPLIVVCHLAQQDHKTRQRISCVDESMHSLVEELGFTVISLTDWVALSCLLTLDSSRDFGLDECLSFEGVVDPFEIGFEQIGDIKRTFKKKEVAWIRLRNGRIEVGDEICIRNGCDSFVGVVKFLKENDVDQTFVDAPSDVGVKLDIGVFSIKDEALVYKLAGDASPKSCVDTNQVGETNAAELMRQSGQFPLSFTAFGMFEEDDTLGG